MGFLGQLCAAAQLPLQIRPQGVHPKTEHTPELSREHGLEIELKLTDIAVNAEQQQHVAIAGVAQITLVPPNRPIPYHFSNEAPTGPFLWCQ